MIKNDIFIKFEQFVSSTYCSLLSKYVKFKVFSDSLESARYDDYVFITCRLSQQSVCINVRTKQPMFFDDKQTMLECTQELLELSQGINILEIK